MSFGRLTASAFSGTIDTTVALASLNFDFSLIKVEAPKEYKDFGLRMSGQRTEEAETGMTHVTARKLGALFADIAPPCPNLIAAYGLRVSEISKSPTHNPKGTRADGIFADKMGADGTTIWAAATSGSSAIAVHLLACMLARMWPAPKAISIWVELILERKKVLLGQEDQGAASFSSLSAAQVSISRDQIAKWDSSARAWLHTADAAKQRLQKQMMLIVNNISTAVNDKHEIYESVILAWRTAMVTVENLVLGMSQSIQNGAPLLGLLAWHLYPDMVVLGDWTKEIKQGDDLIPAGTLVTVGLQYQASTSSGVFWSLPLAHLRFYGDPVVVQSSTEAESGLTVDQLMQVALGSFLGQWVTKIADFEAAARVLLLMSDTLRGDQYSSPTWLGVLAGAAKSYLNASGLDLIECKRLIKSGRRRYPNFLGGPEHRLPPFLGLTVPKTLLSIVSGHEERLWVLRNAASKYGESARKMVIRYSTWTNKIDTFFECATVVPCPKQFGGQKRSRDGTECIVNSQIRWIYDFVELRERRRQEILTLGEHAILIPEGKFELYASPLAGIRWSNAPRSFTEAYNCSDNQDTMSLKLSLVIGDPAVAALYLLGGESIRPSSRFTMQDVESTLRKNVITSSNFGNYLTHRINSTRPGYYGIGFAFISLRALCSFAEVYKDLPDVRIAVKVAETPIHSMKWVQEWADEPKFADDLGPFNLSYGDTFSCIAMFESGSFDINPKSLKHVMAMSSSNSIFVAAPLLLDPADSIGTGKVRRVVGNVGRSGISMMKAPDVPKIGRLPDDTWNHINHNDFDGSGEDCFQHTTLHLSFTDWEMPIDVGDHGIRDREAFFIEAPVSIHHRGKWVADVDILKMLLSRDLTVLSAPRCLGHQGIPSSIMAEEILAHELVTIDSWEELLDSPMEPAVIRAQGNWQARLAAAALSVQLGHETRIVPRIFCWSCYFNERDVRELVKCKYSEGSRHDKAEEESSNSAHLSGDENEEGSDDSDDISYHQKRLILASTKAQQELKSTMIYIM